MLMNKKEFSPYVRTAMFSVIKAPFHINKRVIFDYEIIFVSGGKCEIIIDGKKYLCKKNDVVFIRPDIPHEFKSAGGCDFIQPHIHFDVLYNEKSEETPISFKPKNRMTDYELSLIAEDILKAVPIPSVFIPRNPNEFKKIFFDIIEIFQKKPYNYELLLKSKMLLLLGGILAQFEKHTAADNSEPNSAIINVKNYIDDNFLSPITLDSLSMQFYFNKYTLMRKFKAMYGKNIIAYYHDKRIEYIKNALQTTAVSITDLSEKLNFSDIYSFSRFFKTHTGCSPSAYRKSAE